jgi:hypothetical protein
MKSTSTTVTTAATLVFAAEAEPQTIYLRPSANDIFVGASDVTSSTGLKVTNAAVTPIFVRNGQTLYAITGSGSHDLVILSEEP